MPTRASCSAAMARRSSRATPRMRRPKATLSITLSQGIRAWRWKTTPRSAPGPSTGLPSSLISPSLGARKPAMLDNNVVLPQPEAPMATTKSPSLIWRLTLESASSGPSRVPYLTVRPSMSSTRRLDLRAGRTTSAKASLHRGFDEFGRHIFCVVRQHLGDAALLLQEFRGVGERLDGERVLAAAEPGGRCLLLQIGEGIFGHRGGHILWIGAGDLADRLRFRRIGRPFRLVRRVFGILLGDQLEHGRDEILVLLGPAPLHHDGVESGLAGLGDIA